MKIYSRRLLSQSALLCLLLAMQPSHAADSTTTSDYHYGSGAPGMGVDPKTGSPAANFGNTNIPFNEQYSNLSGSDLNPTGDPFDKTPIHEVNNVVSADGSSSQQIYDYSAANERALPGSWIPGTSKQIPTGPNPQYQSQEVLPSNGGTVGLTGLRPATTAIQAGAIPDGTSVKYEFTQTDPGKHPFTYGFDSRPLVTSISNMEVLIMLLPVIQECQQQALYCLQLLPVLFI